MRTGIYGGTFSPPHIGHIEAARAFSEQMALDELLIIPALVPPHKQINENDDPELRLELCRLAFSKVEGASVSDMELRRGGKSYTVMTLRELTQKGRELFLLCGTDMILTLDTWYCAEEIFSLCTPVCIRREDDEETYGLLSDKLAEYKSRFGVEIPILDVKAIEISSSEIRDAIKSGNCILGMLTESVESFIKERGMYEIR